MQVTPKVFDNVVDTIITNRSRYSERDDLVKHLAKQYGIGYKVCWDIVNYVMDVMTEKN